ncbi:hypothetical protein [Deinococcus roseus]|uniref:Uncharacterized protein n=1 Tax=Deinococcus roseus TaxID=392414 RepID=A0ABQ2D331_9DEIO|nr:hypothetical protein [Deinococcus roseus]GGJ39185.1 hypothetical protein GCM10008938_26500 [Deinococcus roseus]
MKIWNLLFIPVLLASCAQFRTPTRPQPPVVKPSNILEVQFEGVGSEKPTSRIIKNGQNISQPGISRQGISEISPDPSFKLLNVETLTDKVNQVRYIQATYEVTNNSGSTINRLFFAPVDLDDDGDPTGNAIAPTIGNTPFKKVSYFDGTDASSKAADLTPGPAVLYDFQARDYLEDVYAAPFYDLFDPSTFHPAVPTGLAAVNVQNYAWYLDRALEDGDSATVTFSVSFPVDATPANNPFSFSMLVATGKNDEEFAAVGEELNYDTDFAGAYPAITLDTTNQPVVAWQEESYYGPLLNFAAQWDGNSWNLLDGPFNNDLFGFPGPPSIVQDGTDSFLVTWSESDDVFVKQWNGSTWVQLGTELDVDATQTADFPKITIDSTGQPVVAWTEVDATENTYQVYVKQWDGAAWNQLGGTLNLDVTHDASEAVITHDSTGNPVVGWIEETSSGIYQLFVKQWDGTSWNQVGTGAVNAGSDATTPYIVSDASNHLTVAWSENTDVYVSQWDGTSWNALGTTLDMDPANLAVLPSVGLKPGGLPVVSWVEFSGAGVPQVVASVWNGTAWVRYGDVLNNDFDSPALQTALVTDSTGVSHVAFSELSDCGCAPLIYVKSFP